MTKPHSILIIDDDPDIRDVLSDFLAQRGYIVGTESSGRRGMKVLERNPPDVVLLDIDMPGLNGLEVLRRIMARNIDVAVIMVSGYDDEDACRAAVEANVDLLFRGIGASGAA